MKRSDKNIFIFLVFSFILVLPFLSAITNSLPTQTLDNSHWEITYSTDLKDYDAIINNAYSQETTICLISKTETKINKLEDKNYYLSKEDKAVKKIEKTVAKDLSKKDKAGYCYNTKKGDTYLKIGDNSTIYEWVNNTFLIHPVSIYEASPFQISIYDCNGNQLQYPNINWTTSSSDDNRLVFYPMVGQTNLSCIRFRTNTLESEPLTIQEANQFQGKQTTSYQLSFADFESKNVITNKTITAINNGETIWQKFWDILSFWDGINYDSSIDYYDIEYRGQIVDLDPSLELTLNTAYPDAIQFNQTEGTSLGARLQASVLSMDFNSPGENLLNLPYQNSSLYEQGTYIKDGSVYNNFGTTSGLTAQYWWNGNTAGQSVINGSLQFDGVNDCVEINNFGTIGYSTIAYNQTISFWGKTADLNGGFFITNNRSGNYGGYGQIYANTSSLIYAIYSKVGSAPAAYRVIVPLGSTDLTNWNHYVVSLQMPAMNTTGSFSGNVTIYINGNPTNSKLDFITDTNVNVASTTLLMVGCFKSNFGNNFLNGSLDDVIIWNRILNSTEVNQTYQEGIAGRTINLTSFGVDRDVVNDGSRVSYYSFDSNNNGTDEWSGINGACTSTSTCPTWQATTGYFRTGAYSFDTGDYINLSNNFNFEYNQSFSVSAWVQGNGVRSVIWSKGSSPSGEKGISFGLGADNTFEVRMVADATHLIRCGSSGVVPSTLSLVTMTYNGNGATSGVKLYINGVDAGATSVTNSLGGLSILNSVPAYIGSGGSLNWKYSGVMDEVMIFNKSLSATEVYNLYSSQKLHLQLDELSGTTASTVAGSTTGTLTNYPTTATTAPVYNATGGPDGSGAYVFDGVDDYISNPSMTTYLNGVAGATISVWAKADPSNGIIAGSILSNHASGTSDMFNIRFDSTGKIRSCIATVDTSCIVGSGSAYTISTNPINDSKWHHIVIQTNGTYRNLYVDGILNSNKVATGTVVGSASQFCIGNDGSTTCAAGGSSFNGTIDNVLIFNRALSENEILNLYNGNLANKTIKYSTQNGDFTSGVFYNITTPIWNITLSTADTTARSGIVNADNSINLSNPNLVIYTPMDGNFLNVKNNANYNFTVFGKVNNVSGLSSGAMQFDGVTGTYASTPLVQTTVLGSAPQTISIWAKPTGAQTAVGIASLSGSILSTGPYWLLQRATSTTVQVYSNSGFRVTYTNILDNNWYKFDSVYNGTTWLYYLNGNLVGNYAGHSNTTTNTMWLGVGYNGYFNGTLDEFMIYNTALTESQIRALYKSGLSQHANTNVTIQTRTANNYNVSDPSLRGLFTFQQDNLTVLAINDSKVWWYNGSAPSFFYGVSTYFRSQLAQQAGGNNANHIFFNYTAAFTGQSYVYVTTYGGYTGFINFTLNTDNGIKINALDQNILPSQWRLLGIYNFTKGQTYNFDTSSAANYRIAGYLIYDKNIAEKGTMVDETGKVSYNQTGQFDKWEGYGLIGSSGYSNSLAYVNTNLSLNGATAVTYSAWVYPTVITAGGYNPIIDTYDAINSYNHITVTGVLAGSVRMSVTGTVVETPANVLVANKWQHITGTWSSADNMSRIYLDGKLIYNASLVKSSILMTVPYWIGASPTGGRTLNGMVDEARIYNRALSASEVADLYNQDSIAFSDWTPWTNQTTVTDGIATSTTPGQGKFMQYKSYLISNTTDVSPYVLSYNVSTSLITNFAPKIYWVSQTPADINTQIIFENETKIVYRIIDDDEDQGLNYTNVTFYWKINTSTSNSVQFFLNGSSYQALAPTMVTPQNFFNRKSQWSNVSENWTQTLNANEFLPGTYNINEFVMENTPHNIITLTNTDDSLLIELLNINNETQYNFLELMINSTANAAPLQFYYCNSSYTSGKVTTSPHCHLFNTLLNNQTFNHVHSNYASHQTIPMFINSTSGSTNSLKVTPRGYFVARMSSGAGDWYAYNIPNTARLGASKTSNTAGTTWTNQTYTFDSHLHQFYNDSYLRYYACANDLVGLVNCSGIKTDSLELGNLPPTAPNVYNPPEGFTQEDGIITINWTASESPNGYPILFYNVSLLNSDLTFNQTLITSTTNLSYLWNGGLTFGSFHIQVTATDINNLTGTGVSGLFSRVADATNPFIEIIKPMQDLWQDLVFSIKLNATDSNAVSNIWYNFNNGLNYTYTGETTKYLINGQYTIYAYANDSYNNINSTSRVFNVGNVQSNQECPSYANQSLSKWLAYPNGSIYCEYVYINQSVSNPVIATTLCPEDIFGYYNPRLASFKFAGCN